MLSPTTGDEPVRYVSAFAVSCFILLPIAGCGSSGLRFWRGTPHGCDQCMACDGRLSSADTVTFDQPPMAFDQLPVIGVPTIEHADPDLIPDNFRAIEPETESLPSDPDLEEVPVPTPDPAT